MTRWWAALLVATACEAAPAARPAPSPPPPATPASTPSPTPSPARIACGPLTPRTRLSDAWGYPLGPVVVFVQHERRGPVRLSGPPSKTVLHIPEPFSETYTLRGTRCRDGAPLQLWFGAKDKRWKTVVRIRPMPELPNGRANGYGGYLRFAGPGRHRLAVSLHGQEVAAIVVDVTFR